MKAHVFGFVGVVTAIAALIHAYLWLRLVRAPAWPEPWRTRATWTLAAGLARFGPTWLYVIRGTGLWGPPMRVGAPAEATVVESAPAKSD